MPLSPKETADMLNRFYMGFDEEDASSPLGVTISMAADLTSFDSNVFCAPMRNTSCFNGQADCRMSASLYNHKMLIKTDRANTIAMTMSRCVGYVFNQDLVETSLGKCSYAFDGAASNRYNGGCGVGAPGNDCSRGGTAFQNICPSTGKICTADDQEVTGALCKPFGPSRIPDNQFDFQCMWSGPALNYPRPGISNHLRDMANARASIQNGTDTRGKPLISQWNEVVLDVRVLLQAIQRDPASAITFVYVEGCPTHSNARRIAESMRDKFSQSRSISDGRKIPVVGIAADVDFTSTAGPFFAEDGSDRQRRRLGGNLRRSQR